ncbi:hypothetical protein J3Q64DRAFT_1696912 [Phycomyces blakesleeanus]|uniref:Secreted protein n=2 Tax=Phycomyces blakesleeanus TaxID=4837 RepID=A0A167NIW2_PHYB8|nr:hypothetical protein PHYBLDRAFT_166009 [Phycomyces blakesleeanus NRRL 1555(-)]OAD76034.1 hypothetical protein PHYBLDRAFT_166009 [Phycomyces blakesleeanus NRRL 1555(-)]|eukprot:XP_018294074.1 hypothetical protein PHYBLDRAFT_166009 [Phycomyces blakesleeanus NRRL 1555(-)]
MLVNKVNGPILLSCLFLYWAQLMRVGLQEVHSQSNKQKRRVPQEKSRPRGITDSFKKGILFVLLSHRRLTVKAVTFAGTLIAETDTQYANYYGNWNIGNILDTFILSISRQLKRRVYLITGLARHDRLMIL